MRDQLVQVCCPSGSSPELIDPVVNSSREVVELRAEVERLRRENLEFRQQVGYWKSRYRDTLLRNAALEQKIPLALESWCAKTRGIHKIG